VGIPEDLVEEVGRVYGYDRVPPTLPGMRRSSWTPSTPSQDRGLDQVRDVLAGAGLTETWNPALVSGKKLEELRVAALPMAVQNGLAADMAPLRTPLLPALIDGVGLTRDRGREDVGLYEIAEVYLARVGEKNVQPDEPLRVGVVMTAGSMPDDGEKAYRRLKSVLDGCVASLASPPVTYQRAAAQLFHPGRCAAVVLDGRQLGYLGELHPTVTSRIGGRVVAFEIDVEPVLAGSRVSKAQPLPRYPSVDRDLAVVVEGTVAAGALLLAIKESAG